VNIGPAIRPRHRIEKKGKDRTGQSKSHKVHGNILPIWGEAPTLSIETKICMVVTSPCILFSFLLRLSAVFIGEHIRLVTVDVEALFAR